MTMVQRFGAGPMEIDLNRENAAYIIYTSGSTGLAKGVVVEHGNVVRLVRNSNYIDYLGLKQEDRFLLTGAFSFDISTFEIWGMLLSGIGIYMVDKDVLVDAELLRDVVVGHGITILHMVPQLLNHQVEGCPGLFAGLSCLLVGGDMVNPGPVNYLRNTYPGLKILHMYGPTENTTFSTYFPVEQDSKERIPIGRPISHSIIFILDNHGALQPVGVNGEIFTGGDGVARGYLNNPELTNQKFLPGGPGGAVFSKSAPPGRRRQKLYKTGDLGRWLPGGDIEFSGRMDHQVKIRGFRIELEEIENQLMKYPGIREAVLIVHEGEGEAPGADRHLAAYIVGGPVDIAELREYLSRVLPDYMIPSYFIQLERFPLTNSGKVDRKALPSPGMDAGDTYTAPRNEIEKRLVDIWSKVLARGEGQVPRIGIDDSFFHLGGHSLSAMLMTSGIHKQFQVKITLAEVFQTPTIRDLAKYLEKAGEARFIPITLVEKKEYYPVSFQQKRLWILRQLQGDNVSYHMPMRIELAQVVDEGAVKKSLQKLTHRHESMRTAFKEIDGIPFQVIAPNVEVPFRTMDISRSGLEEKQLERERLFREAAVTVFDFTRAPFFRAILIKCDESVYDLVIVMHHIITDGWSMQILEREFTRFYEDGGQGEEFEINPLSFQYKDYCHWYEQGKGTPEQEQASHRFWLKNLQDGIPVYRLPVDFEENLSGDSGACYQCRVDERVKDNLRRLAGENRTTLSMVMFTIYNILISHISDREDIVCSLISANRDHASVHQVVGYFINSVLIKIHVDPEADFDKLLAGVHAIVTESLQHQSYPVELVLDELGMSYPDIPVSYNMLNLPGESLLENRESMDAGETLAPGHLDRAHGVKFDLGLIINENKEGIQLLWNYKKALFRPQTIESIAGMYLDLLDELSETEEN
jgi:amino acid adenylation domain-containing protein